MKKWIFPVGTLWLGSLLAFGFAPYYYSFLVIPILSCLLWFWQTTPRRYGMLLGWCFGLGYFAAGVSWVFISLDTYGQIGLELSLIFTTLLILYLSLFPLMIAWLVSYFSNPWLKNLLAFPCLWTLGEVGRTYLLTGFPWLALGYSQTNSFLTPLAPIMGVYGLSFVICFLCGTLVTLCLKKAWWQRLILLVLIFLLTGVAYWARHFHWTHPGPIGLRSTLIQQNIPQDQKWLPESTEMILQRYITATQALVDSDLIIWPEAAIPDLYTNWSDTLDALSAQAKEHHASILFGIPIQHQHQFYNGIIMMGESTGEYHKRHLVPFGEYWPVEKWFSGFIRFFDLPMSHFSAGAWRQPPFTVHDVKIAPFICYEIVYPQLVLESARQSGVLLTVSDDSWFGNSIALGQHLQIAQMRSLELQKPQLFSSNTGMTAFINSRGKIIQALPPFTQAVLTQSVVPYQGQTPWSLLGMKGFIIILLSLLTLTFTGEIISRRVGRNSS